VKQKRHWVRNPQVLAHFDLCDLKLVVFAAGLFACKPVLAGSFYMTGPMNVARAYATSAPLLDGRLLIAGGSTGTNVLSGSELYNPATGTWTLTGALNFGRRFHTSTLLPDGRVLVVGGSTGNSSSQGVLDSVEIYDPGTGVWTVTHTAAAFRGAHTATLLCNGKVLVVAGVSATGWLSDAQLYDPVADTWTPTGSLHGRRYHHTATLLPDGRVLVAGGFDGTNALTSAELYDPASGTWTLTGSMNGPHWAHTATMLPDARVLIAGGIYTTLQQEYTTPTAELYDPTNGTWTLTGSLSYPTDYHTATLLPNGQVLVIGGQEIVPGGVSDQARTELYDPATGIWTPSVTMSSARVVATAALLPNGQVLVAGGNELPTAELYDLANSAWTTTTAPITSRDASSATLLPTGLLLVAGGFDGTNSLATTELYNPFAQTWLATGPLNVARDSHTATLLPNGQVLVVGGYDGTNLLESVELYDPAAGIWKPAGPLNFARDSHTATLLLNGHVLIVGGGAQNATTELYDPLIGAWQTAGSLKTGRELHTATLLLNGKVLVAGGYSSRGYLASAEMYDPTTGTWTVTGSMNAARFYHTATLLPGGKVLVAGGSGADPNAEIYDPDTGRWTATGSMLTRRDAHSATLLINGHVLVAGGFGADDYVANAELYDPAAGAWTAAPAMPLALDFHTASLLPNGKILVRGGYSSTNSSGTLPGAYLYDSTLGLNARSQPAIATATSPLTLGSPLVLGGSGFLGLSQTLCGNDSFGSPVDHPIVQLRNLENGWTTDLISTNFSANSFTSLPPTGLPLGWTLATLFVHGIPSTGFILAYDPVGPPVVSLQPSSQVVLSGISATFSPIVLGTGPLGYQWLFNGTNLPGATNMSLVLTNATPAQSGSYVLIATNPLGSVNSSNFELKVKPAFAAAQPAFVTSPTTATLNGMVTPGDSGGTVWFEWGYNASYGNTVQAGVVPSSENVIAVNASLSGLVGDYLYHFRVACSNTYGIAYGADQLFTVGRRVVAWGNNAQGRTTIPAGLSNIVAITAGPYQDLALRNDGTVASWGNGAAVPVPPGLSNVVAIAGGDAYSLALRADGRVIGWGEISAGVTGILGLSNVVAIAGAARSGFALMRDGTVLRLDGSLVGSNVVAMAPYNGSGFYGVLNNGAVAWLEGGGAISALPGWTGAVGAAAGLYWRDDGTVLAIGDGGAPTSNGIPPGLGNVVKVSSLGPSALALRGDGALIAWGDNTYGQTNVPTALSTVVAIAAGPDHGLALASGAAPSVVTLAATGTFDGNISLNATVNPSRYDTFAWFRWGISTNYDNSSPATELGSGSADLKLSAPLIGLPTNTVYHCQAVASNALGTVYGADIAFALNLPEITAAPQWLTLYQGRTATFSVVADGVGPLGYQWIHNSSELILGATDATYNLSDIQFSDEGTYVCAVINPLGSITEGGAMLEVIPAPTNAYSMAVLADNPIGYWRLGETNGSIAYDFAGGHDGLYTNVNLGVPGFDPSDSDTAIQVGFGANSLVANIQGIDFSTDPSPAFSVECWVNANPYWPNSPGAGIISMGAGYGGEQFSLALGTNYPFNYPLAYRWFTRDSSGAVQGIAQASVGPNSTWQHVVAVHDGPGQQERLYVNGVLVGSAPVWPYGVLKAAGPVAIGAWQSPQSTGGYDLNFNGSIDEVAVYNTALSSNRIVAHFLYVPPVPPLITQQPVPTANYVGLSASFSVTATNPAAIDYGPIRYQWKFNGTAIPGATTNLLTMPSLSLANAGEYSVAVSNTFAGTESQVASLTVFPVPNSIDLSTGLVLHLSFDENYLDSTYRGNDATNVGSTSFVAGKIGSGALYYSSDPASSNFNYATLGVRPDLQFGSDVNFSLAYWILYPAGAVQQCDLPVFGNALNSTFNLGYAFAQGGPSCGNGPSSGGWDWTINGGGGSVFANGAPGSVEDGNWHHLAFTFDRSGNAITYLDGRQVDVEDISHVGNLDTGNATVVGQDPTGTYRFGGSAFLDDLGVWRRALSPLEVGAIYLAGADYGVTFATPPSLPFVVSTSPSGTVVKPDAAVSIQIRDAQTSLDPGSVQLWLNGTAVNPTIDKPAGTSVTTISYTPTIGLPPTANTIVCIFGNDATPPVLQTNQFSFAVIPAACEPPASGLVAWWRADGDALDVIGGYNGTLVDGVTFATGQVGQAFNFDGTSNYVQVHGSYRVSGSRTIAAWIYPRPNTGLGLPIATGGSYYYGGSDSFGVAGANGTCTAGPYELYMDRGYACFQSGQIVVPETWNHVAITYDGSSIITFFINGVAANSDLGILDDFDLGTFTIGGNTTGGSTTQPSFNGLIDEVVLYNRALSSDEVAALYAAGRCESPLPFVLSTSPSGTAVRPDASVSLLIHDGMTSLDPASVQLWLNGTAINPAIDKPAGTNVTTISYAPPVGLSSSTNTVVCIFGNNSVPPVLQTNQFSFVVISRQSAGCVQPPSGLVAWWPGDGDGNDNTGGNTSTLTGGLTFSAGEVAQCFQFNGQNQEVVVPDAPSLNLSARFTIEAWVNFADLNSPQPIVCKGAWGYHQYCLLTGVYGPSDELALLVSSQGGYDANTVLTTSGANLLPNTWYHVAATADGTTKSIYLNAQLLTNNPAPAPYTPNSNPVEVGRASNFGSGYFFNGLIDEISIYNRALTQDELQAIYNAGSAGKCESSLPFILFASPSDFAVNPGDSVSIYIHDAQTRLDTNTVQLFLNGIPINPILTKPAGTNVTTLSYTPVGGLPPLSNTVVCIFGNDATPSVLQTNQFSFVVVPSALGRTYDLAADFSATNNPNGPWSYGYTLTLGDQLSLYPDLLVVYGGLDVWSDGGLNSGNLPADAPSAYYNPTTNAIAVGGPVYGSGEFGLYPGPGGEYSVARFTAPVTGPYYLIGSFFGQEPYGTTTDVHILTNDVSVFDGQVTGFGPGAGTSFDLRVTLSAGDHLDFAVGYGTNRNFYNDSTALSAQIVASPPRTVSSGTAVIPGTWSFDFDKGSVGNFQVDTGVVDVFWEQVTGTERQMTPITSSFLSRFGLSLDPNHSAGITNLGFVDFSSITADFLQGLAYGSAPVNGNDDASNLLLQGDVFAVRTSDGNYSKVQVLSYGYDLQVLWVTYAPVQSTVAPLLSIQADGSGGYFIRLNGSSGTTYQLQRAANVTGPWTIIDTNTAPASGFVEFHQKNSPPKQAFYRTLQP
jgi:hypothetical protein